MQFRIVQDEVRQGSGCYGYRIFDSDRLVAHYWHDHKGDEHYIEFINGQRDSWAVGTVSDFIEGGGPQPKVLSTRAVEYLKHKLDSLERDCSPDPNS